MKRRALTLAVLLVLAAFVTVALGDAVTIVARPLLPWFAWMLP